MSKIPKIIVITGAESTGKSTLTESLAHHFNVPYIPEIARKIVENLNREYNYSDVENIAKKQIDQLNVLKYSNHPFIFVDTWLIITKIWFEVVFNKVPSWLENEIQNTNIDLFLVCDVDLPWQPDPVRENGGASRLILHKKYLESLKNYNFEHKIISGKNITRFKNALQHLKSLS